MSKLTLKETETVQRALGIIEGVACGLEQHFADILGLAVEMIDEALGGADDGASGR